MFAFLQQPYAFAIAATVLTATLAYIWAKTTEKDPAQSNKAFFKTLAAAALATGLLTYMASGRSAEPVALEPFDAVPTVTAAVQSGI